MKEMPTSSQVMVLSTSAQPTMPYEWKRFKEILAQTPTETKIAATSDQSGGTLFASADQPSAGTGFTGLVLSASIDLHPENIRNAPPASQHAAIGVVSRAYPHLMEAAQPTISLMHHCLDDARLALNSFEDADFPGVAMRLSAIAAQCATAHSLTTFNESFGAVVSFIRRAAIAADVVEISRPELNAIINALNKLTNNPMISLRDAADILSELSDCGWIGEYTAVERLLASLLNEETELATQVLTDTQQQA
jgi:hypothetical protein